MKRKDFELLKQRPDIELVKTLEQLRDKLWAMRGDLARGKVKNIREIKDIKKDIARIMTLQSAAKKLAAANEIKV